MAIKSYILQADVKAPYVTATGLPHDPSMIRFKKLRRGDIIKAELKHANNKPAFLLYQGVCVIPVSAVKELVTKEIVAGADGKNTAKEVIDKTIGLPKNNTNIKVRYIDAVLIGSLIGLGIVVLAEKKGWIETPSTQNKLYGAAGAGILAAYGVYRSRTQKNGKIQIKKAQE